MESRFSGFFFLYRICVVFIVTIGLKSYRAMEGEYLPHWGEVLWAKILAEALPGATQRTASLEIPRVAVRESN